jgi:hypothetical protein
MAEATRPIPFGLPNGVGVQEPAVILTADGAITTPSGTVFLNKAGVLAATLAAPQATGLELTITSLTAQAHTLDLATSGVNGGSADVGTFGGAIYDTVTLVSIGAHWYVKHVLNVTFA